MPRSPTSSTAPTTTPWFRRLPWTPIGITVALLVTALFTTDPIRDAVTLGPIGEGRLDLPPSYVAMAPISSVLDTLTLLTVGQHIALVLWAIAIFVAVRIGRAGRGTTVRREVIAAIIFLAALIVTYAAAAVLPRPMAQFVTSDETVLAVDFHSHTQASHDGRSGWTDEDVRAWHRAAGFDAVYITDHRSFEGAERGIASNPPFAGQGTMVLQGIEAFFNGEHVNILSAGRRYKGLLTPDLKDIDPQSLMLASLLAKTAPVTIETVPANLNKVPALSETGIPGVMAIEIVDGSPRGLSQTRRDRARIVHIADSLNLALVTGSDNHGWGRAAPGWTLFRVPGWRGMPTDSLSGILEFIMRDGRRGSTRPVERVVAGGQDPGSLVFAGPVIAWRMLATLAPEERVMWLVWTWGLVIIVRGLRRYRLRPSSTA